MFNCNTRCSQKFSAEDLHLLLDVYLAKNGDASITKPFTDIWPIRNFWVALVDCADNTANKEHVHCISTCKHFSLMQYTCKPLLVKLSVLLYARGGTFSVTTTCSSY